LLEQAPNMPGEQDALYCLYQLIDDSNPGILLEVLRELKMQ